jgi:hypothetical protein
MLMLHLLYDHCLRNEILPSVRRYHPEQSFTTYQQHGKLFELSARRESLDSLTFAAWKLNGKLETHVHIPSFFVCLICIHIRE